MAYRTEIERALDEMISDEVGNKFQGLAVVRAQQKWPRLVACERKWDGGLDAHANGALEPDGNGLGLACSTTATIKKVKRDAAKTKEHYPDVRVLIFATPEKVSEHKKGLWAKKIAEEFGLLLQVISREEFVVWLLDPANSDICKDQLGITESSSGEIDALIDQARTHVNPREAKIAIHSLEQIQRSRGGKLSDWQRFRILTNLGASYLALDEGKAGARYFLDAAPLQPDDEKAVGNEVLAYHLLLQEKETREKAAVAVERFPNSTRIRSLWIQSAPPEKTYEELLDATPAHMRKDAEIASALCRKAMACGQLDRAIEHAKDAVEDKPKWSQTHLLLAQAYFARVAAPERTVKPLKADDREATLAKSLSLADDAISAAEAEGVQFVKAHALALKTEIALVQGRKEDAARFAREAFGAGPAELNGRLALAESFIGIGNPDEGIRVLEEAHAQSKAAANVSFMLGQALLHRGAADDLKRAFEVFSTANLANLPRELVDPLTVGAVRALVRAGRFGKIENYVARPEVADSPVMVATIKAYASFRQPQQPQTAQFLDQAVAARRPTDTRSLTNLLGRLLLEAGRPSDALPLLQELFDAQTPNFDVGLLLRCAGLLGRDQVILDTCQALYERGYRDWGLLEFESQYLEDRDYQKAISRLEEFIAANPDHRIAKLRLAMVAMRYGRNDLAPLTKATLPSPDELPMRYAVAAVRVLQWQNEGTLAVDYAYRVLRAHTSEIEAHKAYLGSLMPGARPDIPATMDEVAVGSAVQYSENSDAPAGWFVIEDTDKPSSEFEETPASGDIGKKLLGKKVGDTFVLVKSQLRNRVGKITQILSKYTRRFQAIGGQMELKFPGQTIIWTLHVPPLEKLTVADIQPMLDQIKARSEIVNKLRDIYRTTAITLNMYGARLGHGPCEALFDLATSEDDFVRCAQPSGDMLASAMAILATKSTVVIGRDANVCGAALHHTQHRRKDASDRSDLSPIRIPGGRQSVVMPEQFVCAVDQIDVQGATPTQPYRTGEGTINCCCQSRYRLQPHKLGITSEYSSTLADESH